MKFLNKRVSDEFKEYKTDGTHSRIYSGIFDKFKDNKEQILEE